MVIRTLVSAAILFSSLICHSQASDVDRLTTLITTSQDDTIKVTLLNELVASLRDGDINLAFMYAQQANKLSASLKHRRGNALALEAKTYPNPSQSSLMLDISMPQSQQVRVEIFATTGQYISSLYNRFLPRGNHTLNLNRPTLARGSYFMKITTRNATKTLPVTFQ